MYRNKNNVLEVISLYRGDYNKSYFLRQISRLTKIPLKTCQNALSHLEQEKILKAKTEGKNKYFSLNLENIKAKSCLLQAEIYMTDIFIEKYPAIKLFLKALKTNIPIIVFGSFAGMKADSNSDLDLLIVGAELPLHLLPFKLHKINLPQDAFLKAVEQQETLIKEIEEKHIILNNHSFYVNVMWDYYAK